MLLNLGYLLVLMLASPLLAYRAARQGKYRRGWNAKLRGAVRIPPPVGQRVWFHAVSVGEVNLLGGLIARLRQQHPDLDVVVSTTTATGYELALKRFPPDRVFYCPLDFTWAVRRTLDTVRPDALVLAELEIWPNLIRQATHRGIPVAVINGRLSESSYRGYRRLRRWVAPSFARLRLVAAQNETYANRFADLGTPAAAIHVTGSTKFDDAPSNRDTPAINDFRRLLSASPEQAIFVAGSTQAGEETIVLAAYQTLAARFPHLRLILVPRHAERFDAVAAEIARAGFHCLRRSTLGESGIGFQPVNSERRSTLGESGIGFQPVNGERRSTLGESGIGFQPVNSERRSTLGEPSAPWGPATVVLVDSIGELRHWWGLATVAFVGGSLGNRGGQNMLEPAGYGAAVCFGPNTRNFREIVDELLQAHAAQVVTDAASIVAFVEEILSDPQRAARMGTAAREVIERHQGATDRTIQHLGSVLSTEY